MRLWAPVAAALTALAIAGGIEADGARRASTLEVHVRATYSSFVDNTPVGTSPNKIGPGDDVLIAEKATRGGAKVGRTLVACKVITEALDSQCSFTLRLRRGDIQYAGFGTRSGTETFSITGGTRAYSGARGYVLAKPTGSGGGQHDLTFHFR